LGDNQQLFATKFMPYLPTENELIAEIERQKCLHSEVFGAEMPSEGQEKR
jgi:hypothetical protein